jgi:hypothetical protein
MKFLSCSRQFVTVIALAVYIRFTVHTGSYVVVLLVVC